MDRIYAPWRSRYFTLEQGQECLFCSVRRESDDERFGILRRGRHWFVILNAFPYTSGHIMIASNRHIAAFGELSQEEGAELVELLGSCESALEAAYGPEGMNIGVNRGASAGAGVLGHLHVHVVPRWTGDTNFMTALAETRVVSESIADSFARLRRHFE